MDLADGEPGRLGSELVVACVVACGRCGESGGVQEECYWAGKAWGKEAEG